MVTPDSSAPSPPRDRRRWTPRFRVRTLLVVVVVVGVPLGWFVNAVAVQRRAVATITAAGGVVGYDWQWEPRADGTLLYKNSGQPGPKWLVNWLGVDAVGHVVTVGWRGKQETLPAGSDPIGAIARLDRVVRLDLKENPAVTDAGLARLRGLTALREINLQKTGATGAGLEHLAGMIQLRSLTLPPVPITDADLAPLAGFTKLEAIWGEMGPGVTDEGLVHLRGLTRLKVLCLFKSRVTSAGLATFDHPDQLIACLLGETDVADLAPLHRSVGMKWLTLSRTPINDSSLAGLANLNALELLHLEGTQVTDAGLEHLRGLTRLKHLDLRNSKITDAGLRVVAGLTNLEELQLDGTAVTDAGLALLAPLDRVTRLGVGRTRVTDAGLMNLLEMDNCRAVRIDGLNVTDAGLARVGKVRPRVRWNREPRPTL